MRDTGSSQEQQYVKAVIELHDKYLQVPDQAPECTVLLSIHATVIDLHA